MPEIQQSNVVDNYLGAMYGAQDRVQKQADRQMQMQRQQVADQQQNQQFQWTKEQHDMMAAADATSKELRMLKPGDKMGFDAAVQRLVAQGYMKPEDAAKYDYTMLPKLLEDDAKWQEVQKFRTGQAQAQASIDASRASTQHSLAATQALTAQAASGGDAEFDPQDPFAGLSQKARERLIIQNSKEYADTAKENDKEAQAARTAIVDANRFAQLSKQVNSPGDWSTGTGAVAGFPGVRQAQSALDSRFGEMEAITARLVPKLREPGSGATSDFDAKMFQRGTIGVDKQGKTNDAIVTGIQAAARNMIEKGRFEEAFFKARKTLVGSQDAWQSYLEANPIFDPSSVDMPKINAARVSWRQYFSQPLQQSAAPAPTAAPAPAPQAGAGAVTRMKFDAQGNRVQ